jgi:hypothetical protein
MSRPGLFLFFVLCTAASLTRAQFIQPYRLEIELDNKDDFFNVVNTEDEQLVLLRGIGGYSGNSTDKIELILLDSVLTQITRDTVAMDDSYNFIGFDYSEGSFYMLYEPENPAEKLYVVLGYNFSERQINRYEIRRPFPIELAEFDVVEGKAIFQGMVNARPAVFIHGLDIEKLVVLPGIYANKSNLISLRIDRTSKTINAIVRDRSFRKDIRFSVKTYTLDGQLLRTVIMDPGPDHYLLDAAVSSLEKDKIWISGTYAENRSQYSRGMFIALLSNQGQESISFINYADFDNFFDYMREKRRNRVYNRIERRKEKGKRVKFNYRVLVHEIIERSDEYILIGEAYYPRYSHPNYYATGMHNVFNDNVYFDGYRYTHAVVFAFDRSGKRIWDNCFEINDVLTYQLDQYVSISVSNSNILLMYEFDDVIKTKIIQEDEVINGKEEMTLITRYENDEVRDTYNSFGGLDHWYNNHFYAFGVQDIENMAYLGQNSRRTVFYVNKISFSNENQELN